MGNAHAAVTNNTNYPLVVLVFNYADMVYVEYRSIITVPPMATQRIEALPGQYLKFAIVHDADVDGFLSYKLFWVKSGERVSVLSCEGSKILTFGDHHDTCGEGKVKYVYWSDFLEALEGLRRANLDVPDIGSMLHIPPTAQQQRVRHCGGRASATQGADEPPIADLAALIRSQRTSLRPRSVLEPMLADAGTTAAANNNNNDPAVKIDVGLKKSGGGQLLPETEAETEPETVEGGSKGEADERRKSLSYVPASLPAHSVHARDDASVRLSSSDGSASALSPLTADRRGRARIVGPRKSQTQGVSGSVKTAPAPFTDAAPTAPAPVQPEEPLSTPTPTTREDDEE